MISDKERRRVAKELREAASAKGKRSGSMELMLSKLLGITKKDVGVFGQPVDVAATWRDVYRKLADLIDAPAPYTVIDLTDTERNVHGEEVHMWECRECGQSFEEMYGDYEYCPRCGRKVVRDDD